MKSAESAPHEIHIAEDVRDNIRELLDGPPSNDYNRRQMQLAVEKFVVENPETILDHDKLGAIGMEWADSNLSKGFRIIARDSGFKTHPRFQGYISRITLEDVQSSAVTNKIPEA